MSIGIATKGILGKIMGNITINYIIKYPLSISLTAKKKQIILSPIKKTITLKVKRS